MVRLAKLFLTHKSLLLVLSLVAIALALPSVWTGWQQDDLIHRYYLLGQPDVTGKQISPIDMFRFVDGDTARTRALMDLGVVPWWTVPSIKLSFWRPFTALTHWLDYALWPQNSVMMHVQSLLWFGGMVLLAGLMYRRFLGATWVAGLAALFFALDDAHGLAAGWIANRNALVAGFFGLLVLLVHDRWRRGNWKSGAFVGPFVLVVALLSGESALAICGYLFAYALFLEVGDSRPRVRSIVPYAVVALVWLFAYGQLGYGTKGSGFYVDPISEPISFMAAVLWKAPILLADQLALPPSSIVMFLPGNVLPSLVIWALVVLAVLAVLMVPLVRGDRTARFWATGMLLSLPLICSTMPHSRLLTFTGIGAFGLLAQWIEGFSEGAGWVPQTKWGRVAVGPAVVALLIVHVSIAPVLLPINATSAAFAQKYIQDPSSKVRSGPGFENQDLIIVNHPLAFYAEYFSTSRLLAGLPSPRRVRVLAPGTVPVRIKRLDEFTLIVQPEGGFLASPFDNVFRGPNNPLRRWDEVRLTGMTVTIIAVTDDDRPAVAAFRFAKPLNDLSLRWLQWKEGQYATFRPPALGDSCALAGEKLVF